MKLSDNYTNKQLLIKILVISQLFLIAIFSLSCFSGELSRSEAQTQIEKASDFNSIQTLHLETYAETKGEKYSISKKSASETKEEAMKRDLEYIFYQSPNVALANHLGYISVNQKFIKEVPKILGAESRFLVSVKVRTNEKGKALWNGKNLPKGVEAEKEKQLPLAIREFGEVTGITKQGENTAIVNFTYKWKPTELGQYFDSNSEKFKKLSAELKKIYKGNTRHI